MNTQEPIRQLAMFLRGQPNVDLGLIQETWPDCPLGNGTPSDRANVRQWLRSYPELTQAVKSVDLNRQPSPPTITLAEIGKMFTSTSWAWPGWLPCGLLTILAGESGIGKSFLALRIAACFLRGEPWPDGKPFQGETGAVLWAESEAAQAILFERAQRYGLPLEQIVMLRPDDLQIDVSLDNPKHRDAMRVAANQPDIRFIVLDSLRGAHCRDENSSEVIEILAFLARLARDTGKPVLVIHHLRKRGLLDSNEITLDRLRGSSALSQLARVIWALDRPDPTSKRVRLSVIKNNLGPLSKPLGFEITDGGLMFTSAPEAPHRETLQDRTADLLLALLAHGPRPASELRQEIEKAGLSWATAKKVKERLGIVERRDGKEKRWYWALPARK